MQTLDPSLQHLHWMHTNYPDSPRCIRRGKDAPVFVKFVGASDSLVASGLRELSVISHPAYDFSIAMGRIEILRLPELAQQKNVLLVEPSAPMVRLLDKALPNTRANLVHQGTPPFKGAGVIVGIIDDGIDFLHQNFRTGTNGSQSRILAIWDQEDKVMPPPPKVPAEVAGPGGLGVEWNQDRINLALAALLDPNSAPAPPNKIVRHVDGGEGHGTLVAGVAAGDGSQAGNCRGQFAFVGAAPEADLIVVKNKAEIDPDTDLNGQSISITESQNLVNAIKYIFGKADEQSKPAVVNISLGEMRGAHTGVSLVEDAINMLVQAKPGRAVVVAAGNSADKGKHARATVPAQQTFPLRINVPALATFEEEITITYPTTDNLTITVKSPRSSVVVGPVPPNGPPARMTINPEKDFAFQQWVSVHPALGSIRIVLFTPGKDNTALDSGCWTLELHNPGTDDIEFNCWLDNGRLLIDRERLTFRTSNAQAGCATVGTPDHTIESPGCAEHAITVGAFQEKEFDPTKNGNELIGAFSANGPTGDGRFKPDLVAPGVGIITTKAGATDTNLKKGTYRWCCDCCFDFYTTGQFKDAGGTSIAAPFVTGIVALMLQKNPTLTADDIKGHLQASARFPLGAPPGPLDPNVWGAGIVDAFAAVGRVSAASGASAGTTMAATPPGGPQAAPEAALPLPPPPDPAAVERARCLVSHHFSEVRSLVRMNRRVGAVWTRCRTAAAHSPRSAVNQRDLEKFMQLLWRYGSRNLKSSIERHGDEAVQTFAGLDIRRTMTAAIHRGGRL